MTTVESYTKAKVDELIGATIVDADVVGGELVFTKEDGTTINLGAVGGGITKVTAFPTVPAPTDGDVVIRTDQVGDPMYKFTDGAWELQPRMGAVTVPFARVRASSTQSIPANTVTAILLDTEEADTDGVHDAVSNTTRFTARTPGVYNISAHLEWGGGANRELWIRQTFAGGGTKIVAQTNADATRQSLSSVIRMAAGDYIEIVVYSTSSTLTSTAGNNIPTLTMTWLGGAGQTVDERGVPAVRAYGSAVPTGLPHNTFVVAALNSEEFDTDGLHDTATNTSRFTIKTSGTYILRGFFSWLPTSTNGTRWLQFNKNGTVIPGARTVQSPTAGAAVRVSLTAVVQLAAGDYVELVSLQDSGISLDSADVPYFEASLIGTGKTVTPYVKVQKNAAQAIANNSSPDMGGAGVLLTWQTEVSDTDDMHDTALNTDKFVCKTAGVYHITCSVRWAAENSGSRQLILGKNGAVIALANQGAVQGGITTQEVSATVELAVGDFIQAAVYNTANSAVNIDTGTYTWLSMVKVGAPGAGNSGVDPIENWHLVGAPGEPAFANADWTNYDGFAFKKDRGVTYLKGSLRLAQGSAQSAVASVIFILPPGYRPQHNVSARIISNYNNGAAYNLEILTNGYVRVDDDGPAWPNGQTFNVFNAGAICFRND